MIHVFRTVGAKYVICYDENLKIVREAARKCGIEEKRILVLEGKANEMTSVEDLVEEGRRLGEERQIKPWRVPLGKKNSEVCAVLCFSSGTTGLPKAVGLIEIQQIHLTQSQVMISHQNIIAQLLQLLPTTSNDHTTILGLLPFYHSKLIHIPK